MKKQRSPTSCHAAAVLGADIHRDAFADDRSRRRSPAGSARRDSRSIAAACRARRTDRSRCARRCVVWPATMTCDSSRQPSPMRRHAARPRNTGRSRHRCRSTRAGSTRAVGSMCVIVQRHRPASWRRLRPRRRLAVDLRLAAEPPHVSLARRSWSCDTRPYRPGRPACGISPCRWSGSRPASALSLPLCDSDAERARGLRHALDQQHAGQHRIAREMAHEMRLVDGDVLDADGRIRRRASR